MALREGELKNFDITYRDLRYPANRPGRRTGQRWEATRAPIQGPRPRRGVFFADTPFSLFGAQPLPPRDWDKAVNPGVRGRAPDPLPLKRFPATFVQP